MNLEDLKRKAHSIPIETRKDIIMGFKEIELHKFIKELFCSMDTNYLVEITHGSTELGKDLVIVHQNHISPDIIGVIVKCGNIKGETMGEVDNLNSKIKINKETKKSNLTEILSQINQAKNHPAELRNILKDCSVNKVVVLLAGELSKSASTRIKKELSTADQIYDINWLIQNFTDFYPQIFFDGNITDYIINKIQSLEMKNWFKIKEENKKILSEYYVEPLVSKIELTSKNDFDITNFSNLIERKNPFSLLKNLIINKKHVILVGDPGSGKSSALAKITIDLLKEANSFRINDKDLSAIKISIPFLINAKDILHEEHLNNLLEQELKENINKFSIVSLIIDGLDEIAKDSREEIINKAKSIAKELNSGLVISSRKIDLVNKELPGFEKVELLPFEIGQAIQLFKNLLMNDNMINVLKEGLEKIKTQIPFTPLSLLFLVELVEYSKEIPASLTELYNRYINIVLGIEDNKKGIEVLFEYLIKKRFLGELAFKEFFLKNKSNIDEKDFNSFIIEYFKEFKKDINPINFIKDFITDIERSGIFCIKKNCYEFKHRSFLEYFTAFYIFSNREDIPNLNDFLKDIYYDDFWENVVFFYIGLKREINEDLLKKILTYEKTDLFAIAQKFLVPKLLQAGWHSKNNVKKYGLNNSLDFARDIRLDLLEHTKNSKKHFPKIIADILILSLTDEGYKSIFLLDELKEIFYEEIGSENPNLNAMLIILLSIHSFLDSNEFDSHVEAYLDMLDKYKNDSDELMELKARSYIMLSVIKRDKEFIKSLKKRAHRFLKSHSFILRSLLPLNKKK